MTSLRRRLGYILLETLVALAILSVSMVAINRALYQVMFTRALARDYTVVKFLLEKLITEPMLGYWIVESIDQGDITDSGKTFHWIRKIEKFTIQPPPLPDDISPFLREEIEKQVISCGRITVVVEWSRAGQVFKRQVSTLLPPGRLWPPSINNNVLEWKESEQEPVHEIP